MRKAALQDAVRKAGSVGRPVLHAELRIVRSESLALAPEHWRDCAAGETGEIVCRSEYNMLGYWRMPEPTAQTLRGGWVHTGDLATFDDEGFLHIAGRAKDKGIAAVVFDRGGFQYHGRIKALADAAREAGLKF